MNFTTIPTIEVTRFWITASLTLLAVIALFFSLPTKAATSIPFTINLSENVTVTGTPRIQMDVGGTTRYATYTSGSGTNALVFTYTMVSGDVDNDGVTLISPMQLNGGTMKDSSGNNATLTFTPPNTSGVMVNAAVPSGYTVAFADKTVTNVNKTGLSFSLTYPKANKTLHYSIASSGGGSSITGTVTTAAGTTTVNSINATTLPDGKLTLSAYLTDTLGGTGATVTDTIPMAVLDASLVGHWTFDANDISGVTAYDRSGQGNNGTLTNGPTQTTGQVGGALNFDGVNDFGVVPNMNLSATNVVTISVWRYKPDFSPVSIDIEFSPNFNSSSTGFTFLINDTTSCNGKIAVGTRGNASYNMKCFQRPSAPAWHQYTMVYDKGQNAANENSLYIDGAPANFINQTHSGDNTNNFGVNNLYFMSRGGSSFFESDIIDDVRIYNRALTPTEITTLYNAEQ